jgi:hypothetical protein
MPANLHSRGGSRLFGLAICVCYLLFLMNAPVLISAFNSVIEMLAISAILLENFEFSLPPQTPETRITRKPLVLMVPMTEGHVSPWMGLKVRCLD